MHRHFFGCCTCEVLNWGFESQELLNCIRDTIRISREPGELLGVRAEQDQCICQQACSCLGTGVEEGESVSDNLQLRKRFSVYFG